MDEYEFLTVHDVAHRLRVDNTTVRRWIREGTLAAVILPHRGKKQQYRIKRSTLDLLIREQIPEQPEYLPARI